MSRLILPPDCRRGFLINKAAVNRRTHGGHGTTASTPVDSLIQALIDGLLDGKLLKLRAATSGYPHPALDTLLATYTLESPAAPEGNLISLTEIRVDLVSSTAVIAAASAAGVPKYLVFDEIGGNPILGSVGAAGNDFNARLVVTDMAVYAGDQLILPELRILAASALDHYTLTRSPSSGISGGQSYVVGGQAKNSGGGNVNIIGRRLVGSFVEVGGAGANGSVDGTTVVTNRYGVMEPISCIASNYPKTERTDVSDQSSITGSTSNLDVGDIVDSYVLTLSGNTPGPSTTKTLTAQAQLGGVNAAVSGRVITWSKLSLIGATFSSPTSVTNSSGVATVDVTFGAIGTTGTLTGTDAQGHSGTTGTITVTQQPPTYHHLTNDKSTGGGAVDTASFVVPANGWVVARVNTGLNSSASLSCVGSATSGSIGSFTTPSGASELVAAGIAGFDQSTRFLVAQAGAGGFQGKLTFDGSGPDHLFFIQWEIGYFAPDEVSGTFNAFHNSFAADISKKSLTLSPTPAATSTLLLAAGTHDIGGVGTWTPKASPAWAVDSDTNHFYGGFGASLGAHRFNGSDSPAEVTPTGTNFGNQLVVVLEVIHA